MKPVHVFNVIPALPAPLEGLRQLAHNLRWAWHHQTIELFRRLDSDLWESTGHNPVLMLGAIDQAQLEAAAKDESFLAQLDRAVREQNSYLSAESTWYHRAHGRTEGLLVAYFSAEFGLTECLSIFAGGLGVLAGDHLKSASDLGVPLVGVGLLYQQGYFRQYLNAAGWQQESYEDNDFQNLPLTRERRADGSPLTVEVSYAGRPVAAQVWRARVGRVPLFLLDTNLPANRYEDRVITDQLYGGDLEMRLKQEILLGIGGYRALEALGLDPTLYHMNEGHSAFLGLEWVRRLMEKRGLSFSEAREAASAGLIFTGHTPVPAGHDYFPPPLMDRYFGDYMPRLGLSRAEFLGLGRQNPDNGGEEFCMTVLALRMAASSNGVSKLHGKVARGMWKSIWPGVPEDEVPIGHVTNGVHFRSWISLEMNQLYDRYLGPQWREEHADAQLWKRVEGIPAEELWRTHERRRVRLVAFARRHLRMQLQRRGAPQAEIDAADEALDPDLQAGGSAAAGHPAPRAHPQPYRASRTDSVCRQGPPSRRCRQGADPAGRKTGATERVPPPAGVSRGLRYGRGPVPGAGLRHMAQYSASAARSQRHQRHEGAGKWRHQPEHARWMVGRSLAGGGFGKPVHRLGDRTRRELRQSRVPGPGRVSGPVRPAGTGYRPYILRSGRRWPAAALDHSHESFDRPPVPVIQYATGGKGVHRQLLCDGA
jgi:starch phosphorylase